MAIADDGSVPAYVTMHGISSKEAGWRERKASGGAVMDVKAGEVLCKRVIDAPFTAAVSQRALCAQFRQGSSSEGWSRQWRD